MFSRVVKKEYDPKVYNKTNYSASYFISRIDKNTISKEKKRQKH
jgi:hypothetical protein